MCANLLTCSECGVIFVWWVALVWSLSGVWRWCDLCVVWRWRDLCVVSGGGVICVWWVAVAWSLCGEWRWRDLCVMSGGGVIFVWWMAMAWSVCGECFRQPSTSVVWVLSFASPSCGPVCSGVLMTDFLSALTASRRQVVFPYGGPIGSELLYKHRVAFPYGGPSGSELLYKHRVAFILSKPCKAPNTPTHICTNVYTHTRTHTRTHTHTHTHTHTIIYITRLWGYINMVSSWLVHGSVCWIKCLINAR